MWGQSSPVRRRPITARRSCHSAWTLPRETGPAARDVLCCRQPCERPDGMRVRLASEGWSLRFGGSPTRLGDGGRRGGRTRRAGCAREACLAGAGRMTRRTPIAVRLVGGVAYRCGDCEVTTTTPTARSKLLMPRTSQLRLLTPVSSETAARRWGDIHASGRPSRSKCVFSQVRRVTRRVAGRARRRSPESAPRTWRLMSSARTLWARSIPSRARS